MSKDEGEESRSGAPVAAAAFSPDGRTLLTGSRDGTLAEWDVRSGRRRRVLQDPRGVEEDPSRSAPADEDGREKKPPVRPGLLVEGPRGFQIQAIGYFPGGESFAAGADDGKVVIRNAGGGGELRTWAAHRGPVAALEVSPDGRWLATGARDRDGKTLRVWRISRERDIQITEAFGDDRFDRVVFAVAFSPDSRFVAAGGWPEMGYREPRVYELATGQRAYSLDVDVTRAVRFSPDGGLLATGDEWGTVKIWNAAARERLFEIKGHQGIVSVLRFTPDSRRLVTGGCDGGLKVWSAGDGKLLFETALRGVILDLRLEGNAVLLAAESGPGDVRPRLHRLEI